MALDQLSFLSSEDQLKFKQLFDQSTSSTSISPDAARNILLKSNLGPHQLAKIWELSDINKTGDLLFPEFALALHLCNIVLRGSELPYQLDPQIKEEVTKLVDEINFNVPEGGQQQTDQQQQQFHPPKLLRSVTQDILESRTMQQQQNLLLQNQPTGYGFQTQQTQQFPGLPPRSSFTNTSSSQVPTLSYQPTGYQQQQTAPVQDQQYQPNPPVQSQASAPNPFQSQPIFAGNTLSSGQNDLLNQQQSTNFSSLQNQPTQPFPTQPSQPQQPTGLFALNQQSTSAAAPLANQQTGLAPLNNQQTGLVPLNNQQTGLVPLNPQQTSQIPLNTQQTGGLVPLNQNNTQGAPLNQQPTGLIPLNTQQTGSNKQPLTQQPTGLVPLNNQATGSTKDTSLTQQQTGTDVLQRQATGLIPIPNQNTGFQPLAAGSTGGAGLLVHQQINSTLPPLQSQKTGFGNFEPLRQQKTGVGHNSFFLSNLIQKQEESKPQFFDTVSMYNNQEISIQEKQLFNKIFENYDINKKGMINADVSAEIFRKSGLNRGELEKIWDLITRPNQSKLDKESFQLGMWLVYKRLNGNPIPEYLPDSLKPSSLKILDDVKNKLKLNHNVTAVKKSSNSKIDASRFKNNDDELVMSVSRHRRRKTTTDFSNNDESTSKKETNSLSTEKMTTEELKKAIWEKKILLEAIQADSETVIEDSKVQEAEDLQVIETLKREIMNLPISSSNPNELGSPDLKSKFNELTIKVPNLIKEISWTISQIKNLKLDLYKIENPSAILGTGLNGEITDADRKKFKSKQLLAVKMAKLTGKPLDPEIENFNIEEEKLHEEVEKIQKDNEHNQKIIKDVEDSISELSKSITAALNDGNAHHDDESYKKWELGIGVQPEVQEIIKMFRVDNISQKFSNISFNELAAPINTSSVPSFSSSVSLPSTPSTPTLTSTPSASRLTTNFKTPEERKAYIREQARKKMSEKLAKFGIRSTSSSKPSSPAPIETPTPTVEQQQQSTPVPIPVAAPVQPQQIPAETEPQSDDDSSDDDDEEEFQRMEEIRRLKKLERDQRLAQLQSEEDN